MFQAMTCCNSGLDIGWFTLAKRRGVWGEECWWIFSQGEDPLEIKQTVYTPWNLTGKSAFEFSGRNPNSERVSSWTPIHFLGWLVLGSVSIGAVFFFFGMGSWLLHKSPNLFVVRSKYFLKFHPDHLGFQMNRALDKHVFFFGWVERMVEKSLPSCKLT